MKKNLLVISMMLVFAVTLGGCATTGDLAKVQSQQMATGAKADQAAQDAQAAKAAADVATIKAEAAATRADEPVWPAKPVQVVQALPVLVEPGTQLCVGPRVVPSSDRAHRERSMDQEYLSGNPLSVKDAARPLFLHRPDVPGNSEEHSRPLNMSPLPA